MQANLNKFQTELIKLSLSEAELSISLIVITVLAIIRPHEWASNPLPHRVAERWAKPSSEAQQVTLLIT